MPDEPTIAHVRWYDSLRSRSGTYRRCASGASQPSARGGGAPRVHERLNSGYGTSRGKRRADGGSMIMGTIACAAAAPPTAAVATGAAAASAARCCAAPPAAASSATCAASAASHIASGTR